MLILQFYMCRICAMSPIEVAVERVGGPTKLAGVLGVSAQAVCFWRDGKRRLPVEFCATIERESAVRRWDLRPEDWHRIWPELIGAEGAPGVPALAAEASDAP